MSDVLNNVKPLEYFLFRNYSVALKNWLLKNVYLSSYSHDNNVTVAYMTPEKAFSKYIYPTLNGATTSPNINFYLSSYEYTESENSLGFVKEYKKFDNNTKAKVLKPPLVYSLNYSCSIFTRNLLEMDVIIYQLVSKAHKNAKAVVEVDGQWAEISVGNPTNETGLEPAERQDIIHRWAVEIKIPRAYLPLDYFETGTITGIPQFDLETD